MPHSRSSGGQTPRLPYAHNRIEISFTATTYR